MWWWVLIWALLLACAAVYIGSRLWELWGQSKDFGREVAIAQQRLDQVQGQLELLGEKIGSPDQLAVFGDPGALRKEHERTRAAMHRQRRHHRRVARPSWARHVD